MLPGTLGNVITLTHSFLSRLSLFTVLVETAVQPHNTVLDDLCQQAGENNNVLIVWTGHRSRLSESSSVDVLEYLVILILDLNSDSP